MNLEHKNLIDAAIKEKYPEAKEILIQSVLEQFLEGSVYYAEFVVDGEESEDCFYYIFIEGNNVELLEDGIETIKHLQLELDKRRNIIQRLNEFSLFDLMGAVIASLVTLAFLFLVLKDGANISKEMLAIFSIVIGYYFGKTMIKEK
jgi:hypothetical protein